MLKRDPAFRRLRVGSGGVFGSATYWLGKEHLLVVEISGHVEGYRRFMYSDIQSVIVRKTNTAIVTRVSLTILLAVMAGIALGNTAEPVALAIFTGLTVVVAVLLVISVFQGPSCMCHVRTAVATTPLPYLNRWRKAQLFIAELTPLVTAAQTGSASTPVEPVSFRSPQ